MLIVVEGRSGRHLANVALRSAKVRLDAGIESIPRTEQEEARKQAKIKLVEMDKGVDPVIRKRWAEWEAKAESITLQRAWDDYRTTRALKPGTAHQYELLIKRAADNLKITCIANRLSILTQPLNGRPACHYCGQCGRACAAHANFSSPSVLLPPALATKRLTIVTNAMAREVTTKSIISFPIHSSATGTKARASRKASIATVNPRCVCQTSRMKGGRWRSAIIRSRTVGDSDAGFRRLVNGGEDIDLIRISL